MVGIDKRSKPVPIPETVSYFEARGSSGHLIRLFEGDEASMKAKAFANGRLDVYRVDVRREKVA